MQHLSVFRAGCSLLIAVAWMSSARACPFCSSSTAQQVREGIFNADFGYNLGVAAAPFVVLSAVLILIHYWPASQGLAARSMRSVAGRSSSTRAS